MSLKNSVTPPGIDPGIVLLVAQRLNHYATPGPHISNYRGDKIKEARGEGNVASMDEIET